MAVYVNYGPRFSIGEGVGMGKLPKAPVWAMTLFADAEKEKPGLTFEGFADEYLEIGDDGEYRLTKKPTFRCAQPFEAHKFGRADQADLFDQLDDTGRELATRHSVEVVGLHLNTETHRVFTAIQKLIPSDNIYGEETTPLQIRVRPSEYYDAYGVKRVKTKRGKNELIGWDTQTALSAIREASEKRFLFWREQTTPDGKTETIVGIRPAFGYSEVYENLTDNERHHIANLHLRRLSGAAGWITEELQQKWESEVKRLEANLPISKLTGLLIDPDPVFIERIQSRFVVKDMNYLEEIRQIGGPKKSKYPVLFVDLLQLDAARKFVVERTDKRTLWVFKMRVKLLAQKLRMDPWINTRNWKQIGRAVERCAETAREAGYVKSWHIKTTPTGEVLVAHMDRGKFALNLALDEKRKRFGERIRKAEETHQPKATRTVDTKAGKVTTPTLEPHDDEKRHKELMAQLALLKSVGTQTPDTPV